MNGQSDLFDLLAPVSPPAPSSDGGVESRHAGENQPEQRTGLRRESGETNSGSTGDSELARSAQGAEVALGPSETFIHWLVVTTKRMGTACNIVIGEYQRATRIGVALEDQRELACTLDRYDGTVTCPRCKEMM